MNGIFAPMLWGKSLVDELQSKDPDPQIDETVRATCHMLGIRRSWNQYERKWHLQMIHYHWKIYADMMVHEEVMMNARAFEHCLESLKRSYFLEIGKVAAGMPNIPPEKT